jgi:biotin carboxyl carrier protein
MSGTVLKIPMKAGDPVQEGNVVLVLESMKMEIEVRSPFSGTLLEFKVRDGQKVNEGDLLLTVG